MGNCFGRNRRRQTQPQQRQIDGNNSNLDVTSQSGLPNQAVLRNTVVILKHNQQQPKQRPVPKSDSSLHTSDVIQKQVLTTQAELRNILENIGEDVNSEKPTQIRMSVTGQPRVLLTLSSDEAIALFSPKAQLIPDLMEGVVRHCHDWLPMSYNHEGVKYVTLSCESTEYKQIESLFRRTNKAFYKVSAIERVQNPYLYASYLLKKEELGKRFKRTQEKLLFHGSKNQNINAICSNNFNWRLHGRGTGHRFGQGVSFSPIAFYASHYCDKNASIKIMLVVRVLVSEACIGKPQMVLPPDGFDTTKKPDGHVLVKYDDNEFYPAYKIYFGKQN